MADKKTVSSVSTKQMYTTGTGARQFGSREDITKHQKAVFKKFLENPTFKNLELLERLNAAEMAAVSRKMKLPENKEFFTKLEAKNMTVAKKARAKSLFRKMKK